MDRPHSSHSFPSFTILLIPLDFALPSYHDRLDRSPFALAHRFAGRRLLAHSKGLVQLIPGDRFKLPGFPPSLLLAKLSIPLDSFEARLYEPGNWIYWNWKHGRAHGYQAVDGWF